MSNQTSENNKRIAKKIASSLLSNVLKNGGIVIYEQSRTE